jgi:hypothetical protein
MSTSLAMLFFQSSDSLPVNSPAAQGFAMVAVILWAAVALLMIASLWKVFTKAGEPGWAAIVPIYNGLVALKIAGKPMWWILLLLIPFIGFVFGLVVLFAIARKFGKGAGFALGMIFVPPIFYPLLAWGDAQYDPNAM